MKDKALEGIDAILSDRLKELGMDYVADVLEGKKQPSQAQAMFLQTGYVVRLRTNTGTLLIGGARDGERYTFDPQTQPRIAVPTPTRPRQPSELPELRDVSIYYTSYRSERIRSGHRDFWFYVENNMEIEDAIQAMIANYQSRNAVYLP